MPSESNLEQAQTEVFDEQPEEDKNFWSDMKILQQHQNEIKKETPEVFDQIQGYIDEAHMTLFGTTFIHPNWWTEVFKYITVS